MSEPLKLWDIERRVLAYLDQRGPSSRTNVVCDLASPESKTGWHNRDGRSGHKGTNGATTLIMGAWCRRLIKAGLVEEVRDRRSGYRHHQITAEGRATLRRPQ